MEAWNLNTSKSWTRVYGWALKKGTIWNVAAEPLICNGRSPTDFQGFKILTRGYIYFTWYEWDLNNNWMETLSPLITTHLSSLLSNTLISLSLLLWPINSRLLNPPQVRIHKTSIKGHPATKFLITWSSALTSDRCNSLKEGNHTLLGDSSLLLVNTKTFNDFEHKNTCGNLYCQLSSLPHFWSLKYHYFDITLKCKVNALVNERLKFF